MTRDAYRVAKVDEDVIRVALTDCKGDLFRAAHHIGITPRELNSAIRNNQALQAHASAIDRVKVSPEYEALSREQFQNRIDELTQSYRLDALEEIYGLATMPESAYAESASMAEVKLKAAIALRGASGHEARDSGTASILSELNQLYHAQAPRLRSVRATLTVEIGGNDQGSQEVIQQIGSSPAIPYLPSETFSPKSEPVAVDQGEKQSREGSSSSRRSPRRKSS